MNVKIKKDYNYVKGRDYKRLKMVCVTLKRDDFRNRDQKEKFL